MKKRMLFFALLLMAAVGVQAQSLTGTWKTAPETDEDGDTSTWIFAFKQNSQFTLGMTMSTSDPEVGTFEFSLTMPGTYKRDGNTLTLNVDPKKSEGKISKMEFSSEMEELFKDNPELKKTIMDMMQKQVDQELKKSFQEELPFDGDLTIQKLTSTTLELTDDDDVIKFTRVP